MKKTVYEYVSRINQIPYPCRSDFTRKWVYNKGEVLFTGTGKNSEQCTQFITNYVNKNGLTMNNHGLVTQTVFDKDSFSKVIEEYNTKRDEIIQEFKNDLYEDVGFENTPEVGDILYDEAYSRRHSESLNAVAEEFFELVDLFKKVQGKMKKHDNAEKIEESPEESQDDNHRGIVRKDDISPGDQLFMDCHRPSTKSFTPFRFYEVLKSERFGAMCTIKDDNGEERSVLTENSTFPCAYLDGKKRWKKRNPAKNEIEVCDND